jgi:hypothetical protein
MVRAKTLRIWRYAIEPGGGGLRRQCIFAVMILDAALPRDARLIGGVVLTAAFIGVAYVTCRDNWRDGGLEGLKKSARQRRRRPEDRPAALFASGRPFLRRADRLQQQLFAFISGDPGSDRRSKILYRD